VASPASQLLGRQLKNGWVVTEAVPRMVGATGGRFSHGYIVTSSVDGKRAFLKALDFSEAFEQARTNSSVDLSTLLGAMTEAFNFERDVLSKCRDARLSRVVLATDHGTVDAAPGNPLGLVQYLIFELADGDIRKHLKFSADLDLEWTLRCLHNVAVGLNQLHTQNIAHQDFKPSNIMVFDGTISKVGDLGRASMIGRTAPHDELPVAGDRAYAPPELLYGFKPPDWGQRRFGCDAYLLGSMIVFFFAGTGMTSLLFGQLDESQHWTKWRGSFNDILPHLRDAFSMVIPVVSLAINVEVREDLTTAVRQLCDPDPRLRGHPSDRRGVDSQYSLERYISKFDSLASRVYRQKIKVLRKSGV